MPTRRKAAWRAGGGAWLRGASKSGRFATRGFTSGSRPRAKSSGWPGSIANWAAWPGSPRGPRREIPLRGRFLADFLLLLLPLNGQGFPLADQLLFDLFHGRKVALGDGFGEFVLQED